MLLARQQRWDEIELLASSTDWAEEPASFPVFFGMVLLHKRRGLDDSFLRALYWLERAYSCQPAAQHLAMLQLTEASLRAQAGDPVQALKLLASEPLASYEPYKWHVCHNRAMCLRQICEWSSAIEAFDAALGLVVPRSARWWQTQLDRAITCVETGLVEEAMATWADGPAPAPFEGLYHLLGLELHLAMGDYAESIRQGISALRHLRDPKSGEAGFAVEEYTLRTHWGLARSLLSQGDLSQAYYHCRLVALGPAADLLPSLAFEARQLLRTISTRKGDSIAQGVENAHRAHVH